MKHGFYVVKFIFLISSYMANSPLENSNPHDLMLIVTYQGCMLIENLRYDDMTLIAYAYHVLQF